MNLPLRLCVLCGSADLFFKVRGFSVGLQRTADLKTRSDALPTLAPLNLVQQLPQAHEGDTVLAKAEQIVESGEFTDVRP